MSAATILLIIMWLFAAVFFVVLVKDVMAHKDELDKSKMGYNSLISAIANFFDTLGIGSYAIATSAWKFNKSISDDLIPGTLNVAFGIPICVEATITMTGIRMITEGGFTPRKSAVVGLAVALGVGITQVSGCLSGVGFPAWVSTVFGSSSVVVSTLAAILLNLILPREKEDKA